MSSFVLTLRTYLAQFAHKVWQRRGLISTLLLPLAWLVHLGIVVKRHRHTHSAAQSTQGVPVIVVGNLMVGGTGKTPVVIELANRLKALGRKPGIISRGYGVHLPANKARVGKGRLDPSQFGDEPALIAQATNAPVAVHPERFLALHSLLNAYPETNIIISDDGLQHLALPRDIEIVVQDERGLGNGRLLPAGPLRDPASRLRYVDLIINHQAGPSTQEACNLETVTSPQPGPPSNVASLRMRLQPVSCTQIATGKKQLWPEWIQSHRHTHFAALAGIGQPERFFSMLRQQGLQLENTIAMPDHSHNIASQLADTQGELVLITDKDAVKCGDTQDARIWSVQVEPRFSNNNWVQWLLNRLQSNDSSRLG